MPTTNRGYPYETAADEPGWSVTGGSDGSMQILAQVVDADVNTIANTVTSNAAAAAAALAAHEADTTSVHGIANTANLVVTTDPRLSDARTPTAHAASHATGGTDPITAAAIDAYPDTGGALGGDMTLTEHAATVRDNTGASAWRATAVGGTAAVDTSGPVDVTVYDGPDFTTTSTAVQRWQASGAAFAGVVAFGAVLGDADQSVDTGGGFAKLGGKNGLTPVQVCGMSATPGAPAAGTWAAGDLMYDSAGVAHLCTAGGTPGTWT